LPLLSDSKETLSIINQSGENNFEVVKNGYAAAGWEGADLRPYINNMVEAFDQSDLIICRSGATTCAEVAAAGKPAIMVPFPGAADDHQRKNAEAMAENGAVRMILQSELSGERLAKEILKLTSDRDLLLKMGKAAKAMAKRDAASLTADMIGSLAEGN